MFQFNLGQIVNLPFYDRNVYILARAQFYSDDNNWYKLYYLDVLTDPSRAKHINKGWWPEDDLTEIEQQTDTTE